MSEEKVLLDLLNSYLAIEALLESRYISETTRHRAVENLKRLNEELSKYLEERELETNPETSKAA